MKTLSPIVLALAASLTIAAEGRSQALLTWTGSESDIWDTETTANFSNNGSAVKFTAGSNALFNDTPGSDQAVKLSGVISVNNVTFDNNRYKYALSKADANGKLTGNGALTLNNGAIVTLSVGSDLKGGSVVNNGSLMMGDNSVGNIFGSKIDITEGAIGFCVNNTSSNYTEVNVPITLHEKDIDIYTSRYTYWNSKVTGTGDINLYCGGERSYIGHQKEKTSPDWSGFKGKLILHPYTEVIDNAGFYGLIFEGNRTFNPDEIEPSRANTTLENTTLVVSNGTAIASENNDRGVRIGKLELNEGSRLYGYYKSSSKSRSYFLVGNSGTDGLLAGRMCPPETDGNVVDGQKLGLIKEGRGTYSITGNDNMLTGGIKILEGTVLINNDAAEAKSKGLSGATGYMTDGMTQIFVFGNGILGGSGNISGNTDVYGTLRPGDNGAGTLTLADYKKSTPVDLYLRPTTLIEMEVTSADSHDMIDVTGTLNYFNIDEKFEESNVTPLIKIITTKGASYKKGDKITLLRAKSKDSLDGSNWAFRLDESSAAYWSLEETVSSEGYELTAVAKEEAAALESVVDAMTSMSFDGESIIIISNDKGVADLYTIDGVKIKSIDILPGENRLSTENLTGVYAVTFGSRSMKFKK